MKEWYSEKTKFLSVSWVFVQCCVLYCIILLVIAVYFLFENCLFKILSNLTPYCVLAVVLVIKPASASISLFFSTNPVNDLNSWPGTLNHKSQCANLCLSVRPPPPPPPWRCRRVCWRETLEGKGRYAATREPLKRGNSVQKVVQHNPSQQFLLCKLTDKQEHQNLTGLELTWNKRL